MRGRIPNYIKEQAQKDFDEHGIRAHQYFCYNIAWGDEQLSDYDSRYLSALCKIIDAHAIKYGFVKKFTTTKNKVKDQYGQK